MLLVLTALFWSVASPGRASSFSGIVGNDNQSPSTPRRERVQFTNSTAPDSSFTPSPYGGIPPLPAATPGWRPAIIRRTAPGRDLTNFGGDTMPRGQLPSPPEANLLPGNIENLMRCRRGSATATATHLPPGISFAGLNVIFRHL